METGYAAFQKWAGDDRGLGLEARQHLERLARENKELDARLVALEQRLAALEGA